MECKILLRFLLRFFAVMVCNIIMDFSKCEVLPLFKRQDLPQRIDKKRTVDGSTR